MTPTGSFGGYPFQPSTSATTTAASTSGSWVDFDAQLRRRNVNAGTIDGAGVSPSSSGTTTPSKVASYLTHSLTSIIKPQPPTPVSAQPLLFNSQPQPALYQPTALPAPPAQMHHQSQQALVSQTTTNTASPAPAPAPEDPQLMLVEKWRAAQRYKTNAHWFYGVVIGVTALTLAVVSLALPSLVWPLSLLPSLAHFTVRVALLIVSMSLAVVSAIGLFRYYSPSLSLDSVPHRRRRLLGLPYDETVAQREDPKPVSQMPLSKNKPLSSPLSNTTIFTPTKPPSNHFGTPSSARFNTPILTRESELTDAIAGFERHQQQLLALHASPARASTSNPYQTSTRSLASSTAIAAATSQPKYRYNVEDERSDSESLTMAQDLYERLSIIDDVHQWERNARHWLARTVIQPLALSLSSSLTVLYQLASQAVVNPQSQLRDDDRQLLKTMRSNECQAIAMMIQKFPQHPVVLRFLSLVRSLATPSLSQSLDSIGGSKCDSCGQARRSLIGSGNDVSESQLIYYTMKRLILLGSDSVLSGYQWNSGVSVDSIVWSLSKFPTDSQLVMRAFLVWMDEHYAQFSAVHYRDRDRSGKTSSNSRVVIEQTRPHNLVPYYMLVVDDSDSGSSGSQEWRVEPHGHNLFQCIGLFVWVVRDRLHGRLGPLRLDDRSLEGIETIVQ